MRAFLCRNGLDVPELVAVECADDTRVTDGDEEATQRRIVPDDVGNAGQRQCLQDRPLVSQNDQLASVRCAEESAAIKPEAMWSRARYGQRARDLEPITVDNDDDCRVADVRLDHVSPLVVDGPAWPPWKRDLGNDGVIGEIDHGSRAVLTDRLAKG